MAKEIKSTFIRSKMNKDLDARIIPSGEYRDAENISVSRSEGSDVGALENILGNKKVSDFGITAVGVECIGSYSDTGTNRIYLFFTNYTDTSTDRLSNRASNDSYCSLIMYDFQVNNYTVLLQGSFLNLSKTHHVYGINLIENLLFFTDNRNQPRKINVTLAADRPGNSSNPYYASEEVISVAKYYPFSTPELYEKVEVQAKIYTNYQYYENGAWSAPASGAVYTANPGGPTEVPKLPATNFNTLIEIQTGGEGVDLPSNLKLQPGLNFYIKETTPTNLITQFDPIKSYYPYHNAVRNYPIPWSQPGSKIDGAVDAVKVNFGEGTANTRVEPWQWFNNTAWQNGSAPYDPGYNVENQTSLKSACLSSVYAGETNTVFDNLNPSAPTDANLTNNSRDYQPNYKKWFYSNVPFISTDASGNRTPWSTGAGETVTLVFLQPKMKNKVKQFLPPSYRAKIFSISPPLTYNYSTNPTDVEKVIPYLGSTVGWSIASNFHVRNVLNTTQNHPDRAAVYFPMSTGNQVNPVDPTNTYLYNEILGTYSGATGGQPANSFKLTDYQFSCSVGTLVIEVNDFYGWGYGGGSFDPVRSGSASEEGVKNIVPYAAFYLQPGMQIDHPLLNDGNKYIIDQIWPLGQVAGETMSTSISNKLFRVTIRAVDSNNNPVKDWVWPNLSSTFYPFITRPNPPTTTSKLDLNLDLSFPNPDYVPNFGGDSEYLETNFVRLGYRFQFDDDEFSLISPFSQSLFEPLDKGYYIQNKDMFDYDSGGFAFYANGEQEPTDTLTDTAQTGVAVLYRNNVNSSDLVISAPFLGKNQLNWNEVNEKLKIKNIEIVLAESDGSSIRVIKSIPYDDVTVANNTTKNYVYTWDGDKPFKVLPAKETARVSDRVPIRALAQETAGNRIIYGNFIDKHSSPNSLDFEVGVSKKLQTGNEFSSFSNVEYPNHNLKQNRSYQVGVVLSDKYGRQSDVILAPPTFSTTVVDENIYSGDTFRAPYISRNQAIEMISPSTNNLSNWFGDSIKILFNDVIPNVDPNAPGYPGLYVAEGSISDISFTNPSGAGYATIKNVPTTNVSSSGTGFVVDVVANGSGQITSLFINNSGEGYKAGDTVTVNGGSSLVTVTISSVNRENPLGWYTYKVVVKQQEQEYYNLYLPQIINGQPLKSALPIPSSVETTLQNMQFDSTAYGSPFNLDVDTYMTFTTIGSNLNKIPRDINATNQDINYATSIATIYPRVSQFGGRGTNQVLTSIPSSTTPYWKPADQQCGNVFNGETPQQVVTLGLFNDIYNLGTAADNPTSTPTVQIAAYTVIGNQTSGATDRYGMLYKQQDNPYIAIATNNDKQTNPFLRPYKDATTPAKQEYYGIFEVDINSVSTPGGVGTCYVNETLVADSFSGGYYNLGVGVIEVEAVKSNLDIYYETSTSGVISDLNYTIETNTDENIPFSLGIIDGTFTEASYPLYWANWFDADATTGGAAALCPTISNTQAPFANAGGTAAGENAYNFGFTVRNALNQILLTPIVSVTLDSVLDPFGVNVISNFILITSTTSGSTLPVYYVYIKQDPIIYLEQTNYTYTFNITVETTAEIPTDPNHVRSYVVTKNLENVAPILRSSGLTPWEATGAIPGDPTYGNPVLNAGTAAIVYGQNGVYGQSPGFANGSLVIGSSSITGPCPANPTQPSLGVPQAATSQIKWYLIDCYEVNTPNISVLPAISLVYNENGNIVDKNGGSSVVPDYASENKIYMDGTLSAGEYVVTFKAIDANGEGLTYNYPGPGIAQAKFWIQ
jgi:hypothetical protein